MDNLHTKGWLARERDGKAYRYWPTLTREQHSAQLMRAALDEGGPLGIGAEPLHRTDQSRRIRAFACCVAAPGQTRPTQVSMLPGLMVRWVERSSYHCRVRSGLRFAKGWGPPLGHQLNGHEQLSVTIPGAIATACDCACRIRRRAHRPVCSTQRPRACSTAGDLRRAVVPHRVRPRQGYWPRDRGPDGYTSIPRRRRYPRALRAQCLSAAPQRRPWQAMQSKTFSY
jgi:hypothetical protein